MHTSPSTTLPAEILFLFTPADMSTHVTFTQFLNSATNHQELWHQMMKRAQVKEDILKLAEQEAPVPVHLIALAEDWCIDAISTLPYVARLCEAMGWAFSIAYRDQNLALMDRYLSEGTRSIPIILVQDVAGNDLGHWGPRPAELQRWFRTEGKEMESHKRTHFLRRWYARDQGETTLREIIQIARRARTF